MSVRVNSAFPGFFINRLKVKYGITIVMLAIFFMSSSFTDHADPDLRVKQMNLKIRQIGHRLLQQAGDLTSRVLPVTEIKKGTFKLSFENEFVFNHDSLMELSKSLLPKTQFPSGYIVTVHDCITGGMVYGFQLNNNSPDMLACSGRSQPAGCYTIEFTFPDFYENAKDEKAGSDHLNRPVETDHNEANPGLGISTKPGASKTSIPGYDVDRLTEELKPVKPDQQEINPKRSALKSDASSYSFINMVAGAILILLGVTLLIRRFGKILKPVPVPKLDYTIVEDPAVGEASSIIQHQTIVDVPSIDQHHATVEAPSIIQDEPIFKDPAVIKESIRELPSIGNFIFNLKAQQLHFGSEVISLTDKECKVLKLLHKNFGELIPRETLLQEVWIKEGVITGRSLDMFVSKLRKKLSLDPELKITNVHGKGYKLEIPVEKIG